MVGDRMFMPLFAGWKFAITIDIDENITIANDMIIIVAKSFFGI